MLVTCDGPIEPDWVENLNSVLDDNKRLSLQTGETIYLTPHMNVLLEASRLDDCTPATISRCAICYIRRETLPVKATFNHWLSSLPKILEDQQERLDLYANYFISEILENFFHAEHLIYPVKPSWAIVTFIRLFDSLIHQYRSDKYNDQRCLKKIYNRMAIEEAHANNAKAAEIRRKRRQDTIESRKEATQERLDRLRKSNAISQNQAASMKKELLGDDDASSFDSSSLSGGDSSKKDSGIAEIREEDEDVEEDGELSDASASGRQDEGKDRSSDASSKAGRTSVSGRTKRDLSSGLPSFRKSGTSRVDDLVDPTGPLRKEWKAGQKKSGLMRQMTEAGPDGSLGKGRKTSHRVEKEERLRPPEHSFIENDFLFEQSVRHKNMWIDSFFLYSLTWAFGSILTEEARRHFNTWLHQVIKQKDSARRDADIAREDALLAGDDPDEPEKEAESKDAKRLRAMQTWVESEGSSESIDSLILYNATQDFVIGQVEHMEASLPEEVNVFDLFFDPANGRFQNWRSVYNFVREDRANERLKKTLLAVTVPTQDYLRIEYILDRQLEIKKPVCLLGPTAQGKS